MSEQRSDTCPDCRAPLVGDAQFVACDVCSARLYPWPDHPPTGPIDGRTWQYTGAGWVLVLAEDAFDGGGWT